MLSHEQLVWDFFEPFPPNPTGSGFGTVNLFNNTPAWKSLTIEFQANEVRGRFVTASLYVFTQRTLSEFGRINLYGYTSPAGGTFVNNFYTLSGSSFVTPIGNPSTPNGNLITLPATFRLKFVRSNFDGSNNSQTLQSFFYVNENQINSKTTTYTLEPTGGCGVLANFGKGVFPYATQWPKYGDGDYWKAYF